METRWEMKYLHIPMGVDPVEDPQLKTLLNNGWEPFTTEIVMDTRRFWLKRARPPMGSVKPVGY